MDHNLPTERTILLRYDPTLGSIASLTYEGDVPVVTISGYAPVSDLLYGTLLSLVAPSHPEAWDPS